MLVNHLSGCINYTRELGELGMTHTFLVKQRG